MVLVIVLVAIAMLTLAAFAFVELMLSENKGARLITRQAQARALAESGAEMARLYLAQTPQSLLESGGTYSNPERFQAVTLLDDGTPRGRGRFTIVTPLVEQGEITGVRFGLENESARLNLNTLLFLEEQAVSGSGGSGNGGGGSGGSGSGGSGDRNGGSGGSSGGGNSQDGGQPSDDEQSSADGEPSTGGARDLLMALPGMDEQTADAILDWIDEDEEPREFGAESEYYSGLSPGYASKNGPLDTIEELLLVRGITPELLFGADANRNGIIDPHELDRAFLAEATGSDPEVDRGWAAYLTLHSKEANVRPDGTPRIDLNNEDLEALHEELETTFNPDWANFIVAYRIYGPYTDDDDDNNDDNNEDDDDNDDDNPQIHHLRQRNPFRFASARQSPSPVHPFTPSPVQTPFHLVSFLQQPGNNREEEGDEQGGGQGGGGRGGRGDRDPKEVDAGSVELDFTQQARFPITQVLDLVGVRVRMEIPEPEGSDEEPEQVLLKAPFPDMPSAAATYLPLLMDNVTVNPASTIPGRINVNQASRVILQGIPGMSMDPQTVEAIIAARTPEVTAENPHRAHETWLYTEELVDLDQMKQMMPFVTGGGSVYRAQIVGYFDEMGPPARVEAILDASKATTEVPRIVFWRDLSNLGRGFGLDVLGTGAY